MERCHRGDRTPCMTKFVRPCRRHDASCTTCTAAHFLNVVWDPSMCYRHPIGVDVANQRVHVIAPPLGYGRSCPVWTCGDALLHRQYKATTSAKMMHLCTCLVACESAPASAPAPAPALAAFPLLESPDSAAVSDSNRKCRRSDAWRIHDASSLLTWTGHGPSHESQANHHHPSTSIGKGRKRRPV